MSYHTVAVIFARGGSKGVPRKNLRLLAGKPLIAHAIEVAKAVPVIDRVLVSTDDAEIRDTALAFGAEVPFMRPSELALDISPEWLAWQHALRALAEQGNPADVLVSVPSTAPLRAPEDVERAIATLAEGDSDLVLTVTEANRSPYFNMVTIENGRVQVVCPLPGSVTRRQDAPPVFDIATVAYAARAEYVLRADGLWAGRVGAVTVPRERALDIDTELDFAFAEFMMQRQAAGIRTTG